MPKLKFRSLPRKSAVAALALSAVAAFGGLAGVLNDALAQDAAELGEPAAQPMKKRAPKPVRKDKVVKADKPATPPTVVVAAMAAPPAAAAPNGAPDFAVKLKQNGAGTCATQVNTLAAETMGSVGRYNTASRWPSTAGDKRIVAVSIGQKYADSNVVPYAATSIVAAPNPQGSCDAFAFQVVPSPLSCAKLRESLIANGRQIGDLAGVPLMQDAGGQTMLIPTAADTCVLVAVKTAYAR